MSLSNKRYRNMSIRDLKWELRELSKKLLCSVYPHYRPEYKALEQEYSQLKTYIDNLAV